MDFLREAESPELVTPVTRETADYRGGPNSFLVNLL
jgi:hypothetical protein